jgi:CspA family cold shock protein
MLGGQWQLLVSLLLPRFGAGAGNSPPIARARGTKNKKEFQVKENGVVKWFNGAKGYGFIQRASGEDVFVHFSAIQDSGYRTLNEGEAVEFECQQGPKGLSAANVVRNSA